MMQPNVTGGLDPTPPNPGVTALLLAPHAFLLLAAVLAYMIARRDQRHRPVFVAFMIISGAGIVRAVLNATLLALPGPYMGLARAVFHVDHGMLLASLVALPWLTREVFCGCPYGPNRYRYLVAGAVWAGLLAILTLGYPELRGDALRRVYLAAELGALFVCALAIVPWVRRRGWRRGDVSEGLHDHVAPGVLDDIYGDGPRWYTIATVLALVGADVALLVVGAWRHGLFGAAYTVQQAGLLGLYVVVAGLHTVALALTRRCRH